MERYLKTNKLARTAPQVDINYECDVENKHVGKFVIIIDGKVFAYGSNPDIIIRKARKKHLNKIPFMYKVPTRESMLLWQKSTCLLFSSMYIYHHNAHFIRAYRSPLNKMASYALLDSGSSDETYIPHYLAKYIGRLSGGVKKTQYRYFRKFPVYRTKLKYLHILKNQNVLDVFRDIVVRFPDESVTNPSFVILGRSTIFKRHDITFSEKRKKNPYQRQK